MSNNFQSLAFNEIYRSAYNLHHSGHLTKAEQMYHRILATYPGHFDTLYKLSMLYAQQGEYLKALQYINEALDHYEMASHPKPHYAELFNARGTLLEHLRNFEEALASFELASTFKPDYAEAFYNRGVILQSLMRFEEALDQYTTAIALKPDFAEAFNNRGTLLRKFRRFDEALIHYNMAITLKPDYADAHYNKSTCALLLGHFEEGWREYEWRFQVRNAQERLGRAEHGDRPLWRGDTDLSGKTILLHTEQGLGDVILFCRYAQYLAKCGASVILEVPLSLKTLLLSLKGPSYIITRGEKPPAYDVQCSVMSLPLAFGTTLNSIPASTPYLWAESSRMAQWQEKLGPKTGLRIGLAWSGDMTHDDDRNRSIPLELLIPLTELPLQFYSLQKDVRKADQHALNRSTIQDFSGELDDFADTAALISQMDLIISVDTVIAHLAGALGKPVWVLLPIIPDWRWLLDRKDSPWYPTARLFRQTHARDWTKVIKQAHKTLRGLRS